jgi:hypothetical protein
MQTNKKHPLSAYENQPLTTDLVGKLINNRDSKDIAVIYSFKRGEDLYIGRTIDLQGRLKEHFKSPFIDSKKRSCRIFYSTVAKYG